MTVALAGRAPATFEIKSAHLPLVALLLKSPDLSLLAQELTARFGDIPDFFDNEPLVVDLTPLQAAHAEATLDFRALVTLLRNFRVAPLAARGGSPAQMHAAQAAGLTPAPDTLTTPARKTPAPRDAAADDAAAAPATPTAAPTAAPAPSPSALVIDKPLRSGQQVYAKGRDLVVLSMVNAGAEVIADGHIHVYAPLRGKAIAGARGNAEARIFSLCLEPELISIAGVYRTSEVALPADVWGKPTQVRLDGGADGKLIMQAIKA
ncbi:MAG: septum site-determining protein MinC [Ramlibacter sp.]|nr:septum site-determining protein MinC [Ramlibacter sp.]MBX3659817.1 septum site-determining protein MinC [Ramlibacter sp.]